ncbi:hypothetical protein [Paraburkholderia franconis]|uniref:hypothetical protein n=1 Tax=Paraburkholderia franconis TaxID=2654983 RepID=UPI00187B4AC4|nr:hypothetical protein [Paraburkholderia franconis]
MMMQRARENWLTMHRRHDKLECMLTLTTIANAIIKNPMERHRGGPMGACVR